MSHFTLVFLFYIALGGALYSYLLYPFILLFFKEKKIYSGKAFDGPPRVSLIITVHNEERRIEEKLTNSLALDYTPDRLQIIVASDASKDSTNEIVTGYAGKGIKLVIVEEHKGKENAQLSGINAADGDILVFSDVATSIEPDGLRKLVAYFSNQQVGAVSSEDRFISADGKAAGEGAYVRYEMWLRRKESDFAGLVGLSGSFFAARKEVCDEWDIYSPSDFNTALNCAKKGLKAVTMPDVHGYYKDLADPSKEYRRKIRTLIRGFTAISRHIEVLNPFRFGMFAFQVWSHKIMRWGVPWFMLALMISSYLLKSVNWIYASAFYAQLAFYAVVLLGHFAASLRALTLVKIPYFFIQVNIAIAHATVSFLLGKRMTTWTPSQR